MIRIKSLLVLAALSAPVVPALAAPCGPVPDAVALTDADRVRLAGLDVSRMRGLAAAILGEVPEERAVVSALFADGFADRRDDIAGVYQCRTIKLGGFGPLIVYGWFKCEIAREGEGLAIRKVTGSQNFSGHLTPAGGGFVYRGASNYGDEAPRAYGDKADENQVGCLAALPGPDRHLLLELPSPLLESVHDVIELRPAR